MSITYYKRFKMDIDLRWISPAPRLPDGYFWVPWDEALLELHSQVHYRSFCSEIDVRLFPSFADQYSCLHLMSEIRRKPGFLPAATWLVACGDGCCGSVQGVRERFGYGSIQNVGVVPEHRNHGLGEALIWQALQGFRDLGLRRAYLEVTADNEGAVRLYRRLGFRKMKTLYKAVDE
jgi:ribosomal protein S18 acetylase RimI-like enzyme